ncbi:MAG: sulfur carrier protein ThiS adenylyltransferase ThiF [Candidatus Aminicenantes bacterium]|nr:sulfur carrier protein ThiS adenylyltransferase ThiF [Candidatus Aminicenantes bacterium]
MREGQPKTSQIFQRNVPGTTDILLNKTVAIAGLGGLGSNVAVSLVRCGVGKLIVADHDVVELSNLNRQFYFLKDVGKKKTDAIAGYLKKINPELILDTHWIILNQTNVCDIFKEADLLIEAFDKAEEKAWLIETWCGCFADRPIIVASGLAGYGKTDLLRVERSGNIFICGDGKSDSSMGLNAARVAVVANMQANVAVEILISQELNQK